VTLRNALDSFPDVRLPAAEMAKDYWQPEVRHNHKHNTQTHFKRYTNFLPKNNPHRNQLIVVRMDFCFPSSPTPWFGCLGHWAGGGDGGLPSAA
jgi:hypothetical protein